MDCEFCGKNQKDLYLFNLPCGFSICSDHIYTQKDMFKCPICLDHLVEKQKCLEMRKNQKKIDKIKLLIEKKSILELCDKIDALKNDPKSILYEHLASVTNRIDIKREMLKIKFSKLVDDYYEALLKEIRAFEFSFIDLIQPQINNINTEKIRNSLKTCEDNDNYKVTNEFDVEKSELDDLFNKLQISKNFKFVENFKKLDVELEEFFGTLNSNEIMNNLKLKSNKSGEKTNWDISNKFNFKCVFGINYFIELSNDKIVSPSFDKSTSLNIINPINEQIAEISGFIWQSKIDFIFALNEDKIVTIDESGTAKIWKNLTCLKFFRLSEKKICFADSIINNIIFIDNTFSISKFNFEIERAKKYFILIDEPVTALRKLSNDTLLTGHKNKIVEWNINSQTKLREHQVFGKVNCIESISDKDFICATDICMVLVKNSELIFKDCSDSLISSVQICDDGNILSVDSLDETIKLWKADNFDLLFKVNVSKPQFAKLLKCGKLAYVDSNGKFHITQNKYCYM